MSDIRINALATTATSSASDDYIAIDGSANGTRKLSAYSPTFGGNLTVSGGVANFAQTLNFDPTTNGASTGYLNDSGYNSGYTQFRNLIVRNGKGADVATFTGSDKSTTLAGNLTVSGTGTFTNTATTASYQTGLRLQSNPSAANTIQSLEFYSSALGVALAAVDALRESGSFASSLRFWSTTGAGAFTEGMRLNSGGNLLLGTTTDAGYKLDVNGTARIQSNLTVSGTTITQNRTAGATTKLIQDAPNGWGVSIVHQNTGTAKWSFGMGAQTGSDDFEIYSHAANKKIIIDSATGNTTLGGNLTVSASGTAYTDKLLRVINGSSAALMTITGDGRTYLGADMGYNSVFTVRRTTGNAVNELANIGDADGLTLRFMSTATAYKLSLLGSTGTISFGNAGVSEQQLNLNTATGNLLLGTPTDSSNGKLQLATHTTAAGGIGLGTDASIWRSGTSTINFGDGTGSGAVRFVAGTNPYFQGVVGAGYLQFQGGGQTILSSGSGNLILAYNGTTALTLDSSQNATFAGTVQLGSDNGLYIKQGNIARWTSTGLSSGTARADMYADSGGAFYVRTGGATTALTISSGQVATFAGPIAIANTVTAAASVASTHKVTISIGGVTYYLLASNV